MLSKNVHPIIFDDVKEIVSAHVWDRFNNKTILVSGANGFLASYIVYFFLCLNDHNNSNCKVIGISRNKDKANKKFGNLLNRKDFEIVISDVSHPLSIKKKINFIIHAASLASPKYYGVDPVGIINANVFGTNNMLQLAHENKVESFLFFSSGEVYGSVSSDKIPTKENEYGYIDINNVRSCYAESKRIGETMCISWLNQYNTPVKIVRPFHTYGPGMDFNDGRVYADFVSDIVSNRDIVLKSDGSSKRAFCYIKDATEGFLRVLLDGKNGEAYNVGNPNEECSVVDLANKLAGLYPEKKLSVMKQPQSNPGYIQSTIDRNCPDINKIGKLGWTPFTSIKDGFIRTIESYTAC